MHEDPVVTPDKFRGVLCDDVKRRHFILDADVKEHTMALASIDAVRNQEGEHGEQINVFFCFYCL